MAGRFLQVVLIVGLIGSASANVAVVSVIGSSLRLEHSELVEMVSEDIDIRVLGGKQLGIAEYHCHFVLHNTSDQEALFQVGFPLDENWSPGPRVGDKVISRYAFTAHDPANKYSVRLVDGPSEAKSQYREMFLWDMKLNAAETRDLWVDYRLGFSIGPHRFRQGMDEPFPELTRICGRRDAAQFAWGYWLAYTTSSEATWKGGRIGRAKFTLHDKEFRSELDSRDELPSLGTRAEIAEDIGSFWFAGALPSSGVPTQDGYRWEFDQFVPGPRIEYVYGVASIPTKVSEMNLTGLTGAELKRVRQILLAAYGGTPQDPELAKLVREEFWYRPDPNFREDRLDPDRQAVLAEVDRHIVAAPKD